MRTLVRAIFAALVLGTLLSAAPSLAVAQSRSLQTGPVVRRQLLYRSDRFELAPSLGMALGSVYQPTAILTVGGRYHQTNSFALGLNVNLGLLNLDTSIASNFEEIALDEAASDRPALEYARPLLMTDFHLAYVPLAGKVNLFGKHIIHYDIYLSAGVGGAMVSSDAEDLSGFEFGPALGVGMRTFVTDQIAVNFLFQDYLYAGADAQRFCCGPGGVPESADESFRNHAIGSVGISVFFPPEVRVSR